MSAWTKWRKIAEGNRWFSEELDWDGPACYELAVGGPRGGGLERVYVGETDCEKRRIADYARLGSHLTDIIKEHLNQGWSLYYRAQIKSSKQEAIRMQNNLLARHDYKWNIRLNRG